MVLGTNLFSISFVKNIRDESLVFMFLISNWKILTLKSKMATSEDMNVKCLEVEIYEVFILMFS